MTNNDILVLAGFALVIGLAAGAKAGWQTDAARPRTVPVRRGERWRLTAEANVEIPADAEDAYRNAAALLGIFEIESMEISGRTFVAVVRYNKDTAITTGEEREFAPGVTMTLTNAEKLS